jgi:hypothetical protein
MAKCELVTIKVSKEALRKLRIASLVKKPKKQYEVLEDALESYINSFSEDEKGLLLI